jgi:hypothetical protein
MIPDVQQDMSFEEGINHNTAKICVQQLAVGTDFDDLISNLDSLQAAQNLLTLIISKSSILEILMSLGNPNFHHVGPLQFLILVHLMIVVDQLNKLKTIFLY